MNRSSNMRSGPARRTARASTLEVARSMQSVGCSMGSGRCLLEPPPMEVEPSLGLATSSSGSWLAPLGFTHTCWSSSCARTDCVKTAIIARRPRVRPGRPSLSNPTEQDCAGDPDRLMMLRGTGARTRRGNGTGFRIPAQARTRAPRHPDLGESRSCHLEVGHHPLQSIQSPLPSRHRLSDGLKRLKIAARLARHQPSPVSTSITATVRPATSSMRS